MSDEISFYKAQEIQAPRDFAFRWHTMPGAFDRLMPPWLNMQIIDRTPGIEDDSFVNLRLKYFGLPFNVHIKHFGFEPPEQFCDKIIKGPLPYWEHYHRFIPQGRKECVLQDHIRYKLPWYLSFKTTFEAFQKEVLRVFTYRQFVQKHDIEHHYLYSKKPLRIAIAGAHGFIGTSLVSFLRSGGHEVLTLTKDFDKKDDTIFWDPQQGYIDKERLEGLDAVVNLAGENIIRGRWTNSKKERIYKSRVEVTKLLASTLINLRRPPDVFVSASAVGYYGNTGERLCDETDKPGSDFLANLCNEWEKQAEVASQGGIRVVHARFGVVISPKGGMLKEILPMYRLGLGSRIGNNDDYLSWISLDDAISFIHYLIVTPEVHGPINIVTPHPVTQYEFAATLGQVLHRPCFLRMPLSLMQLILGEKAEAMCTSIKASALMAEGIGFTFRYPYLSTALRSMFGNSHIST